MANTQQGQTRRDEPRPGNMGSSATDLKHQAQDAGREALERGKDIASTAAHKAGDIASNVGQKAKDTASSVAHSASDLAATAGHKADDATASVGGGMKSLAGTLRENLPHEGMMGRASSTIADSLESGGRYLEEEGLSGMGEDLANLIRRNPIPALFVGIGVGFLLARSLRS